MPRALGLAMQAKANAQQHARNGESIFSAGTTAVADTMAVEADLASSRDIRVRDDSSDSATTETSEVDSLLFQTWGDPISRSAGSQSAAAASTAVAYDACRSRGAERQIQQETQDQQPTPQEAEAASIRVDQRIDWLRSSLLQAKKDQQQAVARRGGRVRGGRGGGGRGVGQPLPRSQTQVEEAVASNVENEESDSSESRVVQEKVETRRTTVTVVSRKRRRSSGGGEGEQRSRSRGVLKRICRRGIRRRCGIRPAEVVSLRSVAKGVARKDVHASVGELTSFLVWRTDVINVGRSFVCVKV